VTEPNESAVAPLEAPSVEVETHHGSEPPWRRWLSPGRVEILAWIVMALVLYRLQAPAALANLEFTLEPWRLNGDAQQQIFPFYRYLEQNAFGHDYIADYYLSSYPLGYRGLYWLGVRFGVDPAALSRGLPHLLWFSTALGLGISARKLGGRLAAFAVLALVLGSNLYLARIQGGLPRSFGFPCLALALVGLTYARASLCVAAVLLGALFYPVAGVIAGLSLAGLLLLPERSGCSIGAWSWRRRLLTLGGTGITAIVLLLPSALETRHFGAVVRPDDVAEYPEAGRGGRYSSESRPPFEGYFEAAPRVLDSALIGGTQPWAPRVRDWLIGKDQRQPRQSAHYRGISWVLLALVLAGGGALLVRERAARRVMLFGVAAVIGHTVSRVVVPYAYLPERYIAYPVPLLGTLAVAACVAGPFGAAFAQGWRRWLALGVRAAYTAGLLLSFAGRVTGGAGLTTNLRRDLPLFGHILSLPENALIAGWPKGIMNAVPYAGRRPALLTQETHQAFHKGYVEEMRRRMRAFVDAYFATSPEPLLRLKAEFGVTHLLVEKQHFRRPPGYFLPFGEYIRERVKAAGGRYIVPQLARTAAAFRRGDYVLIDLAKITPSAPGADAGAADRSGAAGG
jgi:hypothetical protein